MTTRKLGKTQRSVLESLHEHHQYPGGWTWSTPSETVRILDSLVARGLVEKATVETNPFGASRPFTVARYTVSEAGRELLRPELERRAAARRLREQCRFEGCEEQAVTFGVGGQGCAKHPGGADFQEPFAVNDRVVLMKDGKRTRQVGRLVYGLAESRACGMVVVKWDEVPGDDDLESGAYRHVHPDRLQLINERTLLDRLDELEARLAAARAALGDE